MRLYPTLLLSLALGAMVERSANFWLGALAFVGVWVVAFLLAAKADRL